MFEIHLPIFPFKSCDLKKKSNTRVAYLLWVFFFITSQVIHCSQPYKAVSVAEQSHAHYTGNVRLDT